MHFRPDGEVLLSRCNSRTVTHGQARTRARTSADALQHPSLWLPKRFVRSCQISSCGNDSFPVRPIRATKLTPASLRRQRNGKLLKLFADALGVEAGGEWLRRNGNNQPRMAIKKKTGEHDMPTIAIKFGSWLICCFCPSLPARFSVAGLANLLGDCWSHNKLCLRWNCNANRQPATGIISTCLTPHRLEQGKICEIQIARQSVSAWFLLWCSLAGWWFETFLIFPNDFGIVGWLTRTFFSEGWLNH